LGRSAYTFSKIALCAAALCYSIKKSRPGQQIQFVGHYNLGDNEIQIAFCADDSVKSYPVFVFFCLFLKIAMQIAATSI
jgi:hypothetical protein